MIFRVIHSLSDELNIREALNEFTRSFRKKVLLPSCMQALQGTTSNDDYRLKNKVTRFLNDRSIDRNLRNLSDFLKETKNISADIQVVSNSTIEKGTELFLLMNSCPSDDLEHWKRFYEYVFSDALTPDQKVLVLVKTLKDVKSKDGQEIASNILGRLSRELGFEYYKPTVSNQEIVSKMKWTKDIEGVRGISTFLHVF